MESNENPTDISQDVGDNSKIIGQVIGIVLNCDLYD